MGSVNGRPWGLHLALTRWSVRNHLGLLKKGQKLVFYKSVFTCSVVSDSLWLHGLYPTRLLCPWNFPGKNTEVDCHFLLQGFPTQGSNPHLLSLLYRHTGSLPLCHLGSPISRNLYLTLHDLCLLLMILITSTVITFNQYWILKLEITKATFSIKSDQLATCIYLVFFPTPKLRQWNKNI